MDPIYFSLFCGLSAILYGVIISKNILAISPGDNKMQEISRAIQEGAQAYLNRQYLTISFVGFIIFFFIFYFFNFKVSIGYLIGALLSGTAGFVGMHISIRSNVRTAE